MNKKAETNSMLLFLIIIYFVVVSITYGLVGQGIVKYRPELQDQLKCTTISGLDCSPIPQNQYDKYGQDYSPEKIHTPNVVTSLLPLTGSGKSIGFFNGIGVTFLLSPWWANALVFIPLLVMISWLIIIILLHGG
jgi:hypothetical protein